MLLIEVDKARYRRHFNIVIAACISFLVIGSLAFSQSLIYFFPAQEGTHFHWNLLGVIVSALIVATTISANKQHSFFYEVLYVWKLKHALNLITRKMLTLQKAAKMGDLNAMLAIQFSYTGSRQLWTLDDNTITLTNLNKSQAELNELLIKYGVELDIAEYNSDLLKAF